MKFFKSLRLLPAAGLLAVCCGCALVSAAQEAVTAQEARDIALAHAGLTADQVTGLHAEYERDDGTARYEVQFRRGSWEYDYEINARTGQILSWEREN